MLIALLLLAGVFGWPSFLTIQRITFVVIGLVAGRVPHRPAQRPAGARDLGDLLVELHADPAPDELRERSPARCATRR